jgi:hypothetical protein
LTANFAAKAAGVIDVDHGIGANMAFRRDVLAELGGFRDDFPGIGAPCEDTDMFTRLRLLGGRVVFAPTVVVDHIGAPHVSGRRFNWRYMFWTRHNHMLLLARNYGVMSPQFGAWLVLSTGEAIRPPGPGTRMRQGVRVCLAFAALAAGLLTGARKAGLRDCDPRRHDRKGLEIAEALAGTRAA